MLQQWFDRGRRAILGVLPLAAIATVAVTGAACGTSSAKSASTATPAAGSSATAGRGGRGFGNRTPSSEIQTSIAEGTPFAFMNRTPPPEVQTAVAQGTPFPFGGNAPPDVQTAIAEGTRPAGGFSRGGGPGGGAILAEVAEALGLDQVALRAALSAAGSSIQSVAAAHGVDHATLRQKLIDLNKQRLADAVTSGAMTQADADQQENQFESGLDRLIDGNPRAFLTTATPTP